MRNVIVLCTLGAVLQLVTSLPLTASPQAKSIKVDLSTFEFKAKEGVSALNTFQDEPRLSFFTNGWAEATIKIPADGDYEFTVNASCDPAMDQRAKFKLSIDGQLAGKETLLTDDGVKDYQLTATLKQGDRKLTIEFTNDMYKEGEYDLNFYVHGISLKQVK